MKYSTMTDIPINGVHSCSLSLYGDWRINGETMILQLSDIFHLLTDKKIKIISHDRIAWKGMNLSRELFMKTVDQKRYSDCEITYPGIIAKNAPNPYNLKYRMIDGKHRIAKLRQMGIHRSLFYVLEFGKIEKYLKPKP